MEESVVGVTPTTGQSRAMISVSKGVAVAISSRLQSSVVGATLIEERMILVRLKHTLGLISLFAVYVPNEMCGLEE